jgi:hypothetical protein
MRNCNFFLAFLLVCFFAVLLLTSCAVGVKKEMELSADEKTQLQTHLASISGEKLLDYVKKMSSDAYTGRLTGTPEFKACAAWVSSLFEEWGLTPRGDDNSFLQSYSNPYTVVFVGGELSQNYRARGQQRKKKYAYEKEYFPGSQSGDGSLTAEVVYAGYGITAPELSYDDYAGMNVEGKIVLIEPGIPIDPESDLALFKDWKPYSFNQYKLKMAVAHGAKGMLIHDLAVNPDIDYVHKFMVAQVGEKVVQDIFAGSGKTHRENLDKIKTSLQPHSFMTQKVFTIQNFTEHHPKGVGYNVIGQIQGMDPLLKEEVIILGANLDHLGFCYEIMPGANDNASGMAVLLGVAEALVKSPIRPKRSVLFTAFGSKEQAFRGSEAYLKKPVFPKDKTVAYLNLSTVGCGDKVKALGAQNYPWLWAYLSNAAKKSLLQTIEAFPYSNPGRPRLDSDLFLSKGIPSISLGVYGAPTYARTRKDTANTLAPGTLEEFSKILFYAVLDMANSSEDYFEK